MNIKFTVDNALALICYICLTLIMNDCKKLTYDCSRLCSESTSIADACALNLNINR